MGRGESLSWKFDCSRLAPRAGHVPAGRSGCLPERASSPQSGATVGHAPGDECIGAMRPEALTLLAVLISTAFPALATAERRACDRQDAGRGTAIWIGGTECLLVGGIASVGESEYPTDGVISVWPLVHLRYGAFLGSLPKTDPCVP